MKNDFNVKTKERINPKIYQSGYLVLKAILSDIRFFSRLIRKQRAKNILDLGCGVKPYESIFSFADKFVGFDVEKNDRVDDIGLNWNLPYKDNEFDALITTQVLEHTAKLKETIQEIRRVVKKDGLIFVSVPMTFPIHGAPYDYYRFTQYGLKEIFKDFDIIKIIPSSGYIATQIRLINIFLSHFFLAQYLFFPIFLFNNILAIIADNFIKFILRLGGARGNFIYQKIYMSLPENYSLILKNKKQKTRI